MNLQQVQELQDLYPNLRTRSGQVIKTHEMSCAPTKEGHLAVTVKTLFPPSELRRTELQVADAGEGALLVRSVEDAGIADAQRFAELLRGRLEQPAPLRLVKSPGGLKFFVVASAATEPTNGAS